MAKRNFKNALGQSLIAEEKAVNDRFKIADIFLDKKRSSAPHPARSTPKKPKQQRKSVIIDAFTFPPHDHQLLNTIKSRAMKLGSGPSKSELVRAGLHALTELSDKNLLRLVQGIEKMKPGPSATKVG
jgi:hypothetical protein